MTVSLRDYQRMSDEQKYDFLLETLHRPNPWFFYFVYRDKKCRRARRSNTVAGGRARSAL